MSEEKEITAEGRQLAEMQKMRDQQFAAWIKESERGDKLNDFYKNGHYETINREVLEPLELAAFQTIKNPEFDPSNINQVYQLRALCQIIDQIRGKIEQIISDGRAAKIKISEYNSTQPKEGE